MSLEEILVVELVHSQDFVKVKCGELDLQARVLLELELRDLIQLLEYPQWKPNPRELLMQAPPVLSLVWEARAEALVPANPS